MAKNWPLIDALAGGTPAMRAAGQTYLPKFPKEDDLDYRNRLNASVLFPAFNRTSSVLAAKPLSRPMTVTGVSNRVEGWLDNIDMLGTPAALFAGEIMLACLRHGIDGVLVTFPNVAPDTTRTVEEEQRAGVRPYMVRYPAQTILGWHAQRNDQGAYLTQLRLMELVDVADGDWNTFKVKQVRVLYPGRWETWRETQAEGSAKQWTKQQEGVTTLSFIPFVFFYGLREDFGIGKPPLLDLAHMNVQHWQSSSDQQNILHVSRVPILFGKGFTDGDEIVIGSSHATTTSNTDADLKYVEHTGAAIEAGRQEIQDLEDQMRQAGAELTTQRPAVATTATAIRSDDEGNRSTLQQIAEQFEESFELCLEFMGAWVKEESDPEVQLYKDFGSANLGEKGGDLLLRAARDGHVSSETTFEALRRADVIPAEKTWADEVKRLENEAQVKAARQPKQPAQPGGDGNDDN
ncbi:MAG TPA: DUF4055 domain-containing protein [Beijerinckiaceae bacterium]|nr:DUF4055 domain-containing protein [Beijerinckiaceae bacterium]